LIYIRAV